MITDTCQITPDGWCATHSTSSPVYCDPERDPDQLALFDDVADGAALGTEGATRAYNNADPGWRQNADAAITDLIRRRVRFTADDITAAAGEPPHPNAMGGLFKTHRDRIRLVDYTPARRAAAHGRIVGVWEAL